jgi:hypothetical protein
MNHIAGPNGDGGSALQFVLRTFDQDPKGPVVADRISSTFDTVSVGHLHANALSDARAPQFIFAFDIQVGA